MARLCFVSGAGVPSCLLLLAALSSAAVTDGAAKQNVAKAVVVQKAAAIAAKETALVSKNKDMSPQASNKRRSQAPIKRHIRKFDFDAEFATYLGLASQADTARYLAGDTESSYKAPTDSQESPERNLHSPLRLIPGSTPASFAYFTQIYPDDHSNGDIRIEHFSPVIHPSSSDREKARYREQDDQPEHYERTHNNHYPADQPLYAPPTSRSYFGRYSNKQKFSESSEDNNDYGPKPGKLRAEKTKGFDDDSTPDYKMGYRHVGMYHKFHEEDLYPKKTSSEWVPLKSRNREKQEADRDTSYYDPDGYHDPRVSSENFHVQSEHDDDITRIKTNIDNDPPYSLNNFDLAKKEPSIGKLKPKRIRFKEDEDVQGHSFTDAEPAQRVRKHRRRRKKKKHHQQHHRRPGYRGSPIIEPVPFTNPGRHSDYKNRDKNPSFEFYNPVNAYVSPPYKPPERHNSLRAKPYENPEDSYDVPKPLPAPSAPSEPFRTDSGPDLPISGEVDKDVSLEEPSDEPVGEEPVDVDYGPEKLDDLDEDYHIISEAGPQEHAERTKDFDKRLPQDEKVYGSFETFDSQLDSETNKKFEPFVHYPFDEQRKKLASVVEELIETGKSRRRK